MTTSSKRKTPRLEIDAPHTKRLSIHDIEAVDEVIDIQSPVTAATSTVLYSLQYGGVGGYGDYLADSIELPSGKADCNEDDVNEDNDYILGGLKLGGSSYFAKSALSAITIW